MIKHLFKLINKQWRKNIWIVLELFLVISLFWYVVDFFSVLFINSRTPVGFDIENTYKINMGVYSPNSNNYTLHEAGSHEPAENFLRIIERIRQHPEVEVVSLGHLHYPYCLSSSNTNYKLDSVIISTQILSVTPEYFDAFRVKLSKSNDKTYIENALREGLIISKTINDELSPDVSLIGKTIFKYDDTPTFVSEVTNPIKRHEYSVPTNYIFIPFEEKSLFGKNEQEIWENVDICIRVRSGKSAQNFPASFKKEMKNELGIGNFFLADIVPMDNLRKEIFKMESIYKSIQYRSAFTVFFLVNIFLGIIATFWLRIEKRKGEIGIRIAIGSTRNQIQVQMLMESFILMLIALIPAIIVWVNIVRSDLLSTTYLPVTTQRLVLNTLITLVLVIIAIVAGTWYPAQRSAKTEVAEALHYE
ncbi:FtsX-like permease family protein [Parabacteroides sp. OttesenSCG-928-B22]|nr:FtsX-like permease family protein [Parabacteroides sp. OttesenSCG-928-B22]